MTSLRKTNFKRKKVLVAPSTSLRPNSYVTSVILFLQAVIYSGSICYYVLFVPYFPPCIYLKSKDPLIDQAIVLKYVPSGSKLRNILEKLGSSPLLVPCIATTVTSTTSYFSWYFGCYIVFCAEVNGMR